MKQMNDQISDDLAGLPVDQGESIDESPTESPSETDTLHDKYLRLAAEFDNYRKRTGKERMEFGPRAQAELVKKMLDSLDDLARFAHLDPTSTDAATIVHGVELVEKNLMKALSSAGLEIVNPVGLPFDPNLHEAVSTQPTDNKEEDHLVAQVYQPGYLFSGQLLRPARVVVKQHG